MIVRSTEAALLSGFEAVRTKPWEKWGWLVTLYESVGALNMGLTVTALAMRCVGPG